MSPFSVARMRPRSHTLSLHGNGMMCPSVCCCVDASLEAVRVAVADRPWRDVFAACYALGLAICASQDVFSSHSLMSSHCLPMRTPTSVSSLLRLLTCGKSHSRGAHCDVTCVSIRHCGCALAPRWTVVCAPIPRSCK
ncbi:hypothetical protein WOLCODRAFT_138037 [Wolfiporia cocos MD-104 SS10]|uniref:Uncharacterized protein n=1 Tax=Wolfiporia cocos (strain MD-104) TaxID=742152 RepID=A0A2H3JLE5_WOLCO|nr:hypothetical protein WOLCODRAFT_138037 [Wolfiporia cocos MD-104 SS10]